MIFTDGEFELVKAFLYLIEEYYDRMARECKKKCAEECKDQRMEDCMDDRLTECDCDEFIRQCRKMERWARILRENIEECRAIEPDEIDQLRSECLDQIARSEFWLKSPECDSGYETTWHELVVDSGAILIKKFDRHR